MLHPAFCTCVLTFAYTSEAVSSKSHIHCNTCQVVGLGDEQRPHALVHAPLAVIPVPFPRDSFEKAKAAMRVFNALIDRVAGDGAYLRATLRPAAEFDDFTVRSCRLHGSLSSVSSPLSC